MPVSCATTVVLLDSLSVWLAVISLPASVIKALDKQPARRDAGAETVFTPHVHREPAMSFVFRPWQLFALAAVGAAEQDYQRAVEYLMAENRILKAKLGKRRILLTDDERRVLAVKGKTLGRKALEQLATICTPDTILRWHRELIAAKWNHSEKRKAPGRPKIAAEVEELVLRMAKKNPTWGYDRIAGALANLGHELSDTTVGNILKAHGIEPAPERKKTTRWKTFIKSHWEVLAAVDFTTVEVWTARGLVTFYLLFVMELATRLVHFAGCTPNPNGPWMKQAARNLTACDDGFLKGKKYLLMDRDAKFTAEFRGVLEQEGVESVLLPPRSPNLNANLERFFRSLKSESLGRMIFFGETSLRNATAQFVEHYHTERNHQGLGNKLIEPGAEVGQATGEVECRERLGGLLNYYHRRAA
ncbi:MAG TPA: integrase core domain-containing protein [Pirellulales bacterium]|nr:integrase core domain-containing protein [Pirellulales bacterium]